MSAWLRRGGGGSRLKLAQSLGAFRRPEQGDISPLFVFFEVTNEGREPSEVSRLYVRSRKDRRPAYEGPFEGDRDLPLTLGPGETARVWVRAKTLAGNLREAGLGGRPRVRLVVEDGRGGAHEKPFAFRVDDYLRLKDE